MKKITPVGENLLVFQLTKETHKTESGLDIQDTLARGEIIEVSNEYSDIYKKGDIVMFSENSGVSQYYKQKNCLWLNGKAAPQGDIFAIASNGKTKANEEY